MKGDVPAEIALMDPVDREQQDVLRGGMIVAASALVGQRRGRRDGCHRRGENRHQCKALHDEQPP